MKHIQVFLKGDGVAEITGVLISIRQKHGLIEIKHTEESDDKEVWTHYISPKHLHMIRVSEA